MRGACLLLDRFLPSFCPEFLPVNSEGEGESREKKAGKRLEVPLWLMAWDNYSLAAAALDQVCFSMHALACLHHSHSAYLLQMPFDVAVMHKRVVMEVAVNAPIAGHEPSLGVFYDELAR